MKKPVKPASTKKAPVKKPVAKKTPDLPKTASNKTPRTKDASDHVAKLVVAALENLKARNIVTLDVRRLTDVMDQIIIASGTSNRHVKSLADNAMMELKKQGYRVYGAEGEDTGEWVLVDFGGVVLHVMQPHIREFYDLERLWTAPSPTQPGSE